MVGLSMLRPLAGGGGHAHPPPLLPSCFAELFPCSQRILACSPDAKKVDEHEEWVNLRDLLDRHNEQQM